ncbi:hypothetical protein DBV23_15575 [Edwardsiella ictaluri]|uniref:hypothetical protein n=1 Tax=Edwardsiella ictaluri TaxID=67780 RepID=UPI000554082C|nr:hypothetical protein [Edwardsiella ictaluri]AVZ83497.1 hypothetical protein DBV23_15575 [Edwardsiella ictaluri]EKS7764036.1 hypothetical protein [Edwardsiella ictaluri]EKS7770860.1 hypothetical protein [Edwardsiella ictaluri]EKS7774004.1 hypothetical protein [Edwardsiella ictaluri]EKS7777329.1 hypothetical protein [Edwardsiella ictaluri]
MKQNSAEVKGMSRMAQRLLDKIDRLEHAVKHRVELNRNPIPGTSSEKMLSLAQCEWILKDCAMFRRWISNADIVESQPWVNASRSEVSIDNIGVPLPPGWDLIKIPVICPICGFTSE